MIGATGVATIRTKFCVTMELTPLQKPYPPVWYGLHAPESAKRAARKGLRVISLDSAPATRASFDVFRDAWREALRSKAGTDAPTIGQFAPIDADVLPMGMRA